MFPFLVTGENINSDTAEATPLPTISERYSLDFSKVLLDISSEKVKLAFIKCSSLAVLSHDP